MATKVPKKCLSFCEERKRVIISETCRGPFARRRDMPDHAEGVAGHAEDILRVGDWTVEPALNRVSADGKTVRLEPKTMALLAYLADRPGEVASREALLAAVWPGVVVGDDSL